MLTKTLECIDCGLEFEVPHKEVKTHSGLCPNCQLDQYLQETNDKIAILENKKKVLLPALKTLNKKKKELELSYLTVKGQWQELANQFESIDHEMAEIAHLRDLKIGIKKVAKPKASKPANSAATAEKKALKALAGLDPETRALVLAQLNKTN